jgi:hypothetical protein
MAHGHPVPACLLLAPFVDAGHVSQLRPWICSAPRHHRAAALDVVLGPLTPTPTSSNSATSWSSPRRWGLLRLSYRSADRRLPALPARLAPSFTTVPALCHRRRLNLTASAAAQFASVRHCWIFYGLGPFIE